MINEKFLPHEADNIGFHNKEFLQTFSERKYENHSTPLMLVMQEQIISKLYWGSRLCKHCLTLDEGQTQIGNLELK